MRQIELSQGKFALVDDGDYEWLKKYSWHLMVEQYAAAWIDGEHWLMHRLIMNPRKGLQVDHRNRNGLDNQRHNLRIATHGQNMHNQQMQARQKSSRYKGVYFAKRERLWNSQIKLDGKQIGLGYFREERHAAMAYDIWAKDLHGEFASLNFPAEAGEC